MTIKNWRPPEWILQALRALRPPGRMTVSQWADEYRILTSGESSKPGKWRTDFTPYLRAIMDAFNDPEVEEIIFVKPTQVGATEAMLNMMGYAACNDPAPMLVVYPQKELAESISDHRIQPMIQACPELRSRYDENSKRMELNFQGGVYIGIVGANSPSDLASRHVKNLFLDEEDKYPPRAGKEASPAALAMERQKTYPASKKTMRASTPVLENGPIWQAYLTADTQMKCVVDCPHCGEGFVFSMKQLKWSENVTPDEARKQAIYHCPECGCVISDVEKTAMLQKCHWEVERTNGSRRRLAFRMNTFYSPWVRFGDIAAKWLQSYKYPELLQNFINSWLGEPFKEIESQVDAEWLLTNRQGMYRRGEIPADVVLITGGVDVQRKCFYWTVRAWRANMTSFNVAHGKALTWAEVENTMNSIFTCQRGNRYQVNLCLVDSGDQTDSVYDFCAINREWAVACKGSSARMQTNFLPRKIDRAGLSNGQLRIDIDTNAYKDMIFSRFFRDEDNGGWYLHDECDPEYAEMICSEQKVIERVRGVLVGNWRPKADNADNHYWDCEVYAMCAAEVRGIRTIRAEVARSERAETEPEWSAAQVAPQQELPPTERRSEVQSMWREAPAVRSASSGRNSFRRR